MAGLAVGSIGERFILEPCRCIASKLDPQPASSPNSASEPRIVERVLKDQISDQPGGLSPAERAAAWLASVDDLPLTPPLSDEAISRESMYGPRG
jgi:hypothetical protein